MNIWTNGCFDIIHTGHIELFKYAKKKFGKDSIFIVGIDSDRRVREFKGSERPINSQEDRKKLLEAIRYIDKVIIFDTDQELEYQILSSNIDVMIIGEHYLNKRVVGSQNSKRVDFFPIIEGKSTSLIVKKLMKL